MGDPLQVAQRLSDLMANGSKDWRGRPLRSSHTLAMRAQQAVLTSNTGIRLNECLHTYAKLYQRLITLSYLRWAKFQKHARCTSSVNMIYFIDKKFSYGPATMYSSSMEPSAKRSQV